ncbi:MAG: aspartate dehydrogenase [Actinophytocola sp.]|nr:aspartate dehydrogenase [Actinophytocola sp.]
MRVGVIGTGTIGGPLIEALRRGEIAGAQLAGVLTRHGTAESPTTLTDLLEQSDLIVEAAGQDAVAEHGPAIIVAGRDLLVVSVGALADEQLLADVSGGPGRLYLCAGAIGGLDLLRAATASSALTTVRLTTRKHPRSLPAGVRESAEPDTSTVVFDGTAREAASRYPENLNVAATLALATVGMDQTFVTLISDPHAQKTTHVVEASGDIGTYRFEISSRPSPEHPATSAVVPLAVTRAVRSLAEHPAVSFV